MEDIINCERWGNVENEQEEEESCFLFHGLTVTRGVNMLIFYIMIGLIFVECSTDLWYRITMPIISNTYSMCKIHLHVPAYTSL